MVCKKSWGWRGWLLHVLSSSSTHPQDWNAYLLAKFSFSSSRSGSLSFCQSKWTSFHLWWVLGWSLLSWPVMTLSFHSSSFQQVWGLFESAHVLFGIRFLEWGEKEEMLWGFRTEVVQWRLRGLHCCFSPYFLIGYSHRGLCSCSSFCWKDNTSLESQQLSQGEEQLNCGCLTTLAPGPSAGVVRSMSSSSGLTLLPKTQ